MATSCCLCHRPVEPSPEQRAQLASGEIIGVAHVGEFVSASARMPASSDTVRLSFKSTRADINGPARGGRHYDPETEAEMKEASA